MQEPHGHGVEEERALSGETNDASLWVQIQEFLMVKILYAHVLCIKTNAWHLIMIEQTSCMLFEARSPLLFIGD